MIVQSTMHNIHFSKVKSYASLITPTLKVRFPSLDAPLYGLFLPIKDLQIVQLYCTCIPFQYDMSHLINVL